MPRADRDGAIRTGAVAPFGDLQVGEKRQRGDDTGTGGLGILLLAEAHHTLAGEHVIQHIHDIPVVSDADDRIRFGEQVGSLLLVALRQTSGEDDLLQRPLFFQGSQLQNGLDGLLLGGLDKSAGVYDCNVSFSRLGHKLVAMGTQLRQHALRIHQILGTSERNHPNTNWHMFLYSLLFSENLSGCVSTPQVLILLSPVPETTPQRH